MNGTAQDLDIAPGLLVALDGAYASLRAEHPGLPRALVTVEEPHPAVARRIACWRPGRLVTAAGVFEGRIAFGYPSAHRAVPRLLLTAPPASILETLVHEAAHALATARGIKDASRGGTYHNAAYRPWRKNSASTSRRTSGTGGRSRPPRRDCWRGTGVTCRPWPP